MCIEFQHLSCQVVVIKGTAYLLTYFIAVVIAAVAWNQLSLLSVFLLLRKMAAVAFSALAFHVSGLGLMALALTPPALLTSLISAL